MKRPRCAQPGHRLTWTACSVGLNVYEHEPSVLDTLKAIPQVVLTPHIGGGTLDAHEAMQSLVAANIEAYLAGEPVKTPVPEMAGQRPA